MGFKNAAPTNGGHGIHWPYCGTAKGTFWDACYAGGAVWIISHGERPTRPCLHALTGGSLVCAICSPSCRRDLLGYIPVYRAVDNRPCFVIVGADQWDRLRAIRLHAPIRIGREESDGDRVWVRALEGGARYQTTLAARNVAADISESLLRVWRMPELTAWWREDGCRATMPGDPLPATARADSDNPLSLTAEGEGGEGGSSGGASGVEVTGSAPLDAGLVGESMDAVKNRLRKKFAARDAAKNGNGKHKAGANGAPGEGE